MATIIHPTAVVHPGAQLGEEVTIGPLAVVEDQVTLGDRVSIHGQATIREFTSIGSGTEVHPQAVIGGLPQDVSFKGERSYVQIGSDCIIRECATINRGTEEDSATVIGNKCFLMGTTHIAHNVLLHDEVIMVHCACVAGYGEVGPKAFLSANVMVHQFVKVGGYVIAGGGAGISQDVPPFLMLRPASLNEVSGLNVVGLKRAGFTPEQRKEIKAAYKILYREGLTVSEAVEKMKADFSEGPADEFRRFVESAKRGICGKIDRK
jgi:UDP-N-acetylglucosamine acyltransferase